VGLPRRPNVTILPATGTVRTFPALATSLRYIRQFVRDQARDHSLNRNATEELTLAVSEAASNAIRHSQSQAIRVECRTASECMVVEVADEGVFVSRVPLQEVDGLSGKGILLMTAFVDQVAIREGTEHSPGTTVTLTKCG
jgi:anti-sigma regulatory factor (Ser/Thr protein kinase)